MNNQTRRLADAPANSLPTHEECALRCDNSDFIAKRVAEGGHGPDEDTLLASALHRFIYEYDDTDPYRSSWFLHRLELLLEETKRNALAAYDAQPDAEDVAGLRAENERGEELRSLRAEVERLNSLYEASVQNQARRIVETEGLRKERDTLAARVGLLESQLATAHRVVDGERDDIARSQARVGELEHAIKYTTESHEILCDVGSDLGLAMPEYRYKVREAVGKLKYAAMKEAQ